MADSFIGEIRAFGFNWAPKGWALCDGSLLPVDQNQALYSLLNTTYGGSAPTTFALPNLMGRTPVCVGGGLNYVAGQQGGAETVALTTATTPTHTHQLMGVTKTGNARNPVGGLLSAAPDGHPAYGAPDNQTIGLNPASIGNAGASQAHTNMQPSTVLNFCVSLGGIYPARS
jgi:microcystin-dependent protein